MGNDDVAPRESLSGEYGEERGAQGPPWMAPAKQTATTRAQGQDVQEGGRYGNGEKARWGGD